MILGRIAMFSESDCIFWFRKLREVLAAATCFPLVVTLLLGDVFRPAAITSIDWGLVQSYLFGCWFLWFQVIQVVPLVSMFLILRHYNLTGRNL